MNDVEQYIERFTEDKIENVIQIKRNFYQVSEELMKVKNSIKSEPFAIGTYLGSGKPFHPSVALLDWLDKRTDRYVVLDKKASWLFLCGRDIFEDSIVKKNVDSGFVIVKNERGEVLGNACSMNDKKQKNVALKHLLDKGDFLRRERH